MPFRRIRDVERLQALVGAMLLIDEDLELATVLRAIVETALELVDARYGAIGVLDETGSTLAEFVHVGLSAEQVAAIGRLPEGVGVLGLLIKDPRPLRLADIADHPQSAGFPPRHPPMTSFLGAPVIVGGKPYGNLYLADKGGGEGFTQEDEDLVVALAQAAALAIDKAQVHARLRDLTLAEERERMGRDLHDTTIRRLFGVGLTLQGAIKLIDRPEAAERVQQAVDALDDAVRQIRTTVFAVTRPDRRMSSGSLRREVLHVVEQTADGRGLDVRVDFDGPIDAVGRHAAQYLLLTVQEAVAAAVGRPGVGAVAVDVALDDGGLVLRVADDAPGGGAPAGMAVMVERARLLGGECRGEGRPQGGSEVVWRVARLQ